MDSSLYSNPSYMSPTSGLPFQSEKEIFGRYGTIHFNDKLAKRGSKIEGTIHKQMLRMEMLRESALNTVCGPLDHRGT